MKSKFNLLLLENGEHYLGEYLIKYSKNNTDPVKGSLKLCTRCVIIESSSELPLVKLTYKSMESIAVQDELLQICSQEAVYMKQNHMDHPYRIEKEIAEYKIDLLHTQVSELKDIVDVLWNGIHAMKCFNRVDEMVYLNPILEKWKKSDAFDVSLFQDYTERPLLEQNGVVADRVVPLLCYAGRVMLTSKRIYFEPSKLNNEGEPVLKYTYAEMEKVYKRRYMLRNSGLEISMKAGSGLFFSFANSNDRDKIYDVLIAQQHLFNYAESSDIQDMLVKWQRKEISNFEYLQFINQEADRTCHDLTQYPVFPWIIADYDSIELDLQNANTFRDLSKPIGALNKTRLAYFQERYAAMPQGPDAVGIPPRFLYGTHYSTPGYVLYFLVRKLPEYMLCLQNGRFDDPNRLFKSMQETWKSCLNNYADLKELIPCFFDTDIDASEWLKNKKSLDFGTTQQGERVADVTLPPWADNPNDFVRKNRMALESEYVSMHLHEWIDLIFGYKQKGKQAEKFNNLFYYLSYEGSVDLDLVDDLVEKCAYEAQIQEFGQTPKQLFASPHPCRFEKHQEVVLVKDLVQAEDAILIDERSRQASVDKAPIDAASQKASEKVAATKKPFTSKFVNSISFTANKVRTAKFLSRKSSPSQSKKTYSHASIWNWNFKPDMTDPQWVGSDVRMIHNDAVTSVQLSNNGLGLYSTSQDTTMKVVSVDDGTVRRTLTCHLALSSCAVSPNEQYVFIGSWDNNVYMYSVSSSKAIDKLPAHEDAVSAICATENRLLTCSWDATVKLWQYSKEGMSADFIHRYEVGKAPLKCMDMNFKGTIGVAGAENGFVYVLDLKHGNVISKTSASLGDSEISGISLCYDSTSFTCCSIDSSISHYCLDGQNIIEIEADGADTSLTCISSDGKYAVTGSSEGSIQFWCLSSSSNHEIFCINNAHDHEICCINVSTCGKLFVTGSIDGSVRTWQLRKKPSTVFHF